MGIVQAIGAFFQVLHDGFTLAWSLKKTPEEQRRLMIAAIHAAVARGATGDTSAIETIIRS